MRKSRERKIRSVWQSHRPAFLESLKEPPDVPITEIKLQAGPRSVITFEILTGAFRGNPEIRIFAEGVLCDRFTLEDAN